MTFSQKSESVSDDLSLLPYSSPDMGPTFAPMTFSMPVSDIQSPKTAFIPLDDPGYVSEIDIGSPVVEVSACGALNQFPSHNIDLEPTHFALPPPSHPLSTSGSEQQLSSEPTGSFCGHYMALFRPKGFKGVVTDGVSSYWRYPPSGPYSPPPGPYQSNIKDILSESPRPKLSEAGSLDMPDIQGRSSARRQPGSFPGLEMYRIGRKRERSASPVSRRKRVRRDESFGGGCLIDREPTADSGYDSFSPRPSFTAINTSQTSFNETNSWPFSTKINASPPSQHGRQDRWELLGTQSLYDLYDPADDRSSLLESLTASCQSSTPQCLSSYSNRTNLRSIARKQVHDRWLRCPQKDPEIPEYDLDGPSTSFGAPATNLGAEDLRITQQYGGTPWEQSPSCQSGPQPPLKEVQAAAALVLLSSESEIWNVSFEGFYYLVGAELWG